MSVCDARTLTRCRWRLISASRSGIPVRTRSVARRASTEFPPLDGILPHLMLVCGRQGRVAALQVPATSRHHAVSGFAGRFVDAAEGPVLARVDGAQPLR